MPWFEVTFVTAPNAPRTRKIVPRRLSTKTVRGRDFWRAIGRLEAEVSRQHCRNVRFDVVRAAEDLPGHGIRTGDVVADRNDLRR